MKLGAFIGLALLLAAAQAAPAEEPLDTNLQALRPFFGSWRGEFKQSTPEKPLVDVSHWERALNGKAIRILHSINDGMYGGETLMTWNEEKKSIVYHYFTTAGFQTQGTVKVEGRKLVCHEVVTGNAGGTTEVKAIVELTGDGRMESTAEYLKNGKWEPGRAVLYQRAEGAKPKFK